MRDHARMHQPQPRRPRAMDPSDSRDQRDLAAELIRKARIATAIHMALHAQSGPAEGDTR
ncbi:MAG: hypothetical protein P8K80_04945 [Phycisphaerales bacterium]|nr:hypothetical protein [Phycisphaerales bacterium]